MIEMGGEKGSEKSVLAARHDITVQTNYYNYYQIEIITWNYIKYKLLVIDRNTWYHNCVQKPPKKQEHKKCKYE